MEGSNLTTLITKLLKKPTWLDQGTMGLYDPSAEKLFSTLKMLEGMVVWADTFSGWKMDATKFKQFAVERGLVPLQVSCCPEGLDDFLDALGRQQAADSLAHSFQLGTREVWVSEDACLSFDIDSDTEARIRLCTSDPKLMLDTARFIRENTILRPAPDYSHVYMLVRSQGMLGVQPMPIAAVPWIRENYAESVAANWEHTLECFRSNTPCGRLVLLDGPPGTGKSFLLKALTSQRFGEGRFFLVPAGLVGELTGPELLNLLVSQRSNVTDRRRLTLIVEDADRALISRKSGGALAPIAELLNLSDGLMGEVLDVRIYATTNAGRVDLDPAVVRPGRLCRHIHVPPLSPMDAGKVLGRLTGTKIGLLTRPYTLAELYQMTRPEQPPSQTSGGWPNDSYL